jgi:hypothetical protein
MMTNERLRDWDLRELIERIDHAYDGLELLLCDELRLSDVAGDVLETLAAAARYFELLRYECFTKGETV